MASLGVLVRWHAENVPSLGVVHLSDIHLAGYEDGALFDEDADVRRELEYDLESVSEEAGGVGAILLGGDTAGRGTHGEFEKAAAWIDGLCTKLAVPDDRVYCVPGNHDVDWAVVQKDPVLREIRRALLEAPLEQVNARLEGFLASGPNRGLLLSSLNSYSEFAARYGCDLQPEEHRWEQALELGSITVKLIGLSSALMSGPDENARNPADSRLVLGPQASIGRFAETFTVLLCHHPLAWVRDAPNVDHFIDRAHLQLFGHEHLYRAERHGSGVRVYAGAVHPPRGTDDLWEPSYNVIRLGVNEPAPPEVSVDIWARRLHDDGTFGPVPEAPQPEHFDVPLTAVRRSDAENERSERSMAPVQPPPRVTSDIERRVARKFAMSSTETQLLLGERLGLLGSPDAELDAPLRGRNVFHRAREAGRLVELEEEIDANN